MMRAWSGGHPSLPVLRLAEWEAMIDALIDADVPRLFVPLLLFAGVGDVDRTLAKTPKPPSPLASTSFYFDLA